jgi:26S proteasome regulatory subunit T4
LKAAKKEFNKTEDDLKSLQSVGQIIGEVLRPLDNERCTFASSIFFCLLCIFIIGCIMCPIMLVLIAFFFFNLLVIVKASSGPRYVVGCRSKVDKEKLTSGTRVVLDMTTLTIMRALPREVSHCGFFRAQFNARFCSVS